MSIEATQADTATAALCDMDEAGIAQFIRTQIREKTFHITVAQLNSDLMEGSAEARKAARAALERLGFIGST